MERGTMKKQNWIFSGVTALCTGCYLTFAGYIWAGSSEGISVYQTASYTVENMTCATCPITVKKAMARVDGVESIEIDIESKIATVVYDSTRAQPEDIADASTGVGFPATVIEDLPQ